MIGKPEWFTYRVFGWGIAPKRWQGFVYVTVVALLIGFVTAIAVNNAIRIGLYVAILGILLFDVIHIMTQLDSVHDERERMHQLVIERNCSFAAIVALVGVAMFQTYQNRMMLASASMAFPFDYSILIVLGVMLFVKISSTIYVRMRM
jgi:hypothetical protein